MNNELEPKHQQVKQPLLELGRKYRKWSIREKEITTREGRESQDTCELSCWKGTGCIWERRGEKEGEKWGKSTDKDQPKLSV